MFWAFWARRNLILCILSSFKLAKNWIHVFWPFSRLQKLNSWVLSFFSFQNIKFMFFELFQTWKKSKPFFLRFFKIWQKLNSCLLSFLSFQKCNIFKAFVDCKKFKFSFFWSFLNLKLAKTKDIFFSFYAFKWGSSLWMIWMGGVFFWRDICATFW